MNYKKDIVENNFEDRIFESDFEDVKSYEWKNSIQTFTYSYSAYFKRQ
jgi:hypothetical protein